MTPEQSHRNPAPVTPLLDAMLTPSRRDWLLLLLAALLGGALFFPSLGRLWPLIPGNLHRSPAALRADAARFLASVGDPTGENWSSATELMVPGDGTPDDALDYVERTFGRDETRRLIRDGLPLAAYQVAFKRYGDADARYVYLLPDGVTPVGWRRDLQEDEPAPDAGVARVGADDARRIAKTALARIVGQAALGQWTETGSSDRELPHRHDWLLTFERVRSVSPELKERAQVRVAGSCTVAVYHTVVVPAGASRDFRRREGPREALNGVGGILFGIAVLGAFTVFVLRLRDGTAPLARAAAWAAVVFALSLAASLSRTSEAFGVWDPLTPRAVGLLTYVVDLVQMNAWTFAVLVAVIGAGDALDRESGRSRGATLWQLTRGRLFDPEVGQSSARGFLLGCVCGGLMALTVLGLVRFAGARVALQPRQFFFFAINSPLPGLSTLLYFLQVAMLEELGYRYFAGTWLLSVTKRKWLAIVLPGLVYGLTHTSLGFLPPAEPFWARAFVMTLVGCVWGWAFLRWDALTVVTSHLTADLFIFNWPRLASGEPLVVATAILTVALPVLPALGLLGHAGKRLFARAQPPEP